MGFNSGFKVLNNLNDPDRPQCVNRSTHYKILRLTLNVDGVY